MKSTGRSANKRQAVKKALKKANLKEIPKDPETGKWVTAGSAKKQVRRSILDRRIFYLCPKCGKTLVFHGIRQTGKCARCGQRLEWGDLDSMQGVYILAQDSSEAAYWAEKYEETAGTLYGINIDDWRLSLKGFPKMIFFPFPDGKAYGRFMRLASKEAKIVKESTREEHGL